MSVVQKAGAIVFSQKDPEKILLLYQEKHNDFSFPKGHLENNETLEQCAIRETKEETGLDIEILYKLDTTLYTNQTDGNVELTFFVARSLDDACSNPEKGCNLLWMTYEEAYNKLSYENLRLILNKLKENS